MKNSTKFTFKIKLMKTIVFLWIFSIVIVSCTTPKPYVSNFDFDEIGKLHNEILTSALTTNSIEGASKEELFEYVKEKLRAKGKNIETNYSEFSNTVGINIKEDLVKTVNHLVDSKSLNKKQGDFLLNIDKEMSIIEGDDELKNRLESRIQLLKMDKTFSDREKEPLLGFLTQCKYSLELVTNMSVVQDNNASERSAAAGPCNSAKCRDCLKRISGD